MIEHLYLFGGMLLLILAGAGKGMSDRINFHQKTLPGFLWNGFWLMHGDKEKGIEPSWKRKYKNMDPAQGEWFPGSSTIFVAVTDGWHLCQSIYKYGMVIGLTLAYFAAHLLLMNDWYIMLVTVVNGTVMPMVGFKITYR